MEEPESATESWGMRAPFRIAVLGLAMAAFLSQPFQMAVRRYKWPIGRDT
jgi:hypothetical protein